MQKSREKEGMNYCVEMRRHGRLTSVEICVWCCRLSGGEVGSMGLLWTLIWVVVALLIGDEPLSLCKFWGIGCIFRC